MCACVREKRSMSQTEDIQVWLQVDTHHQWPSWWTSQRLLCHWGHWSWGWVHEEWQRGSRSSQPLLLHIPGTWAADPLKRQTAGTLLKKMKGTPITPLLDKAQHNSANLGKGQYWTVVTVQESVHLNSIGTFVHLQLRPKGYLPCSFHETVINNATYMINYIVSNYAVWIITCFVMHNMSTFWYAQNNL